MNANRIQECPMFWMSERLHCMNIYWGYRLNKCFEVLLRFHSGFVEEAKPSQGSNRIKIIDFTIISSSEQVS